LEYKIQLKGITKSFSGNMANDHISIDIEPGEVHSLCGENGAGKSTLMNILYGLIQPDEGTIIINGGPVKFTSSRDSIAKKIGMVHQHFMLIPKLTVTENIIVGQEMGSKLKIDRKAAEQKVKEISEQYDLKINPHEKVANLSVTGQQRVEILKVLYRNAEVLIFDEPTAVLTPQEIDEFCEIILGLKSMGKTIIFISHKLAEVMKISDHITVIRRGQVISTVKTDETNPTELTRMMVGRDVDLSCGDRTQHKGKINSVLELRDISYTIHKTVKKLNNVNLALREGEILGIAGVDGNGQDELVAVICGQILPDNGSVILGEKNITKEKIRFRKEAGIALVPADRHKEGLVLGYSVAENLILGRHREKAFAKKGIWLNFKVINENAVKLQKDFDIRCVNVDVAAENLSGGNQQKIIIAREISRNGNVLIVVQPTRGLDVGAVEFVQNCLMEQRNQGKSIILFSLELDEILNLSDRIAVIRKGEIMDVVENNGVTRQELGLLMLGADANNEERGRQHA
jgi:ABC-type uncharacterized transport system ATPase subunit